MNESYSKLRTFRFLLPLLWRISAITLIVLLAITLVQAFIPIAQLKLTSKLVNEASILFQNNTGNGFQSLAKLVWLQLALLLIGALLTSVFNYAQIYFNERATLFFDELMSAKVNRLSLSYFDNHTSYDQLQRTTIGLQLQGIGIIFTCLSLVQGFITVIGFMIVLYQFHWLLSLGMLLLVIPMLWSYLYESKSKFKLLVHQTPDERMSSFLNNLLKSREAAKEIRVFETAPYLIDKWKTIAWRNAKRVLTLERKTISITYAVQLFTLTLLSGMLLFSLHTGMNGILEIGAYVALSQALFNTQSLVQSLAQGYSRIHQDLLHTNEIIAFVNLPEENSNKGEMDFPSPIQRGIVIDNVSFRYDGAPKSALDGITFTIHAGEKIAIVGDNGAGKSTLAKILLGLYKPSSGDIAVDGINYSELHADKLRGHVSAIFQDFVQYPFPVWENVGLGQVSEVHNRSRLQSSSEQANTLSFINKLPQEWDTVLGVHFDGGHELSYGQWQRIALNRAFYRDFEMIVLDEPTASLDPMTESSIFENLMTLTNGKTAVFITHRLGSCRFADRIIVLKDGRLVENGDHNTLMKLNGEYAEMFRKQASWYTSDWAEQKVGV